MVNKSWILLILQAAAHSTSQIPAVRHDVSKTYPGLSEHMVLTSGEGGIIVQGCIYLLREVLISIVVLFCGNFLELPVRFHVIWALPAGRGRQ